RINLRRSPRRKPAGQQRDANHKSRYHAKRQRIELADVYQRNGQQAGNRRAAGQANENPDCNQLAALSQEENGPPPVRSCVQSEITFSECSKEGTNSSGNSNRSRCSESASTSRSAAASLK